MIFWQVRRDFLSLSFHIHSMSSLCSWISVFCSADVGAECSVALPRRVFVPWHSAIFLCDYLLNDETLETVNHMLALWYFPADKVEDTICVTLSILTYVGFLISGRSIDLWRDIWVQEPNVLRSNFYSYVWIFYAISKVGGCRPL